MIGSDAKAQATGKLFRRRVIAVHLVLTLYGHWAVNDPRGSGSNRWDQSISGATPTASNRRGRS
jgi:hypothetical protein